MPNSFSEDDIEELIDRLGINEIGEKLFGSSTEDDDVFDDDEFNEDQENDVNFNIDNIEIEIEDDITESPDTSSDDVENSVFTALSAPWPITVLDGNQDGVDITSISSTGPTGGFYTKTVTTAEYHNLNDGDRVYIKNINPTGLSERVNVQNCTLDQFSYQSRIPTSWISGGQVAIDLTTYRTATDGSVYADIVIEFDSVENLNSIENYEVRAPYPNN